MRVLLQNPAPDDPADQPFWGDFHFLNSLSHYLRDLGCETRTQYWPSWDSSWEADILLVLRGLRPVEEIEGNYSKKIIWIISHPEDVNESELGLFDLVLCGSKRHTLKLRQQGFDAHEFLQCTDERLFYPKVRNRADFSHAFIFVGNWRGGNRSLVGSAMSANLPLKIWGRVWTRPAHQPFIVSDYFPNAKLGELYRNSFCTLNDHWSDMVSFNYVNNRLFDALACGLPVITDPNPGLVGLGLNGVKTITPEDAFEECIDEFIVNYERYQEAAYDDAFNILDRHSFKARAKQLLALL